MLSLSDPAGGPASGRAAVMQEILQLMERWKLAPEELIDPAERQAALGKARRMVEFWRITPDELSGPLLPTPAPRPIYLYTHPKTGECWDGRGPQPAWLRRCLINEGYRLDEVRAPFDAADPAG